VNLDEIGDAYFEGSHLPQDTRIDKAFSLSRGCCVDFGLSPEKVRKTGQMSKECAFYKFPAIFLQDTFRNLANILRINLLHPTEGVPKLARLFD